MDDLRKDLRSQFEREQAGLGEIRGARETVVTRALAHRDEPFGARLQLATGVAAVVIAALVVATFAYVRAGVGVSRHGPPTRAASAGRLASPVIFPASKAPSIPAGVAVIDMDLVDISTGWVLFTTCVQPMTGTCHYSVGATADSGGTWSKPVQVGGQFNPQNGDFPRTVHFLDHLDGFVYGHAVAFVTHDGGHTWARLNISAVFVSFITGRGSIAWAATYPCAKGQVCPYELRSSVDGGRTWSAPYALPAGVYPVEAVPFAASGLLMATSTDLMITLDAGATWQHVGSKCTPATFDRQVATSDGRELWLLCSDLPTQSGAVKQALFVSEDAGASWVQRSISPSGEVKGGTNRVIGLISLADGTALYTSDGAGVVVSNDRGVTWKLAGPTDARFASVRFSSASDGWAVDSQEYIWATTDGGEHWTQVTGIQILSP
jgi:photosystem II stability/assembly factor-like uncharacterized protein